MPERGWTQKLSGTKGYYGSYAENEQLLRLHEWFYPFFLMVGQVKEPHPQKSSRPFQIVLLSKFSWGGARMHGSGMGPE